MLFEYSWEWWLTEFGPALGGIATFVLVIYYARLYKETKEQTKATRASYAPELDTHFATRGDDFFSISIRNRGQGTARDIQIETNIYITRMGEWSIGDCYRYIAHLKQSLPPQTSIRGHEGSPLRITPKFFLEVSNETLDDAHQRGTQKENIAEANEDVMSYFSEYINDKGGNKYPTESGDILDLFKNLENFSESKMLPIFEVKIRYKDSIKGSEWNEKQVFKSKLDTDSESFASSIEKNYIISLNKGRILDKVLDKVADLILNKKQYRPKKDVTYPYEEDISGTVVHLDS